MTKPASTPTLAANSILPVIVAFFAFAAVMVGTNVRASENSAEDQRFKAALQAFNERWLSAAKNNPEALGDLYTKEAILAPANAATVRGREAIREFWKSLLSSRKGKLLGFRLVDGHVDGNTAYALAEYTLQVSHENGETVNIEGKALRIFLRQPDGSWKIRLQMFNHTDK
jgi:ketosteroid isomerase-like protein